MKSFSLKIVTPDGIRYDGPAEELIVRTTTGDMGFLAGHTDCVATLGMGCATIVVDGEKRYGACIGGMVSVVNGSVSLVPTTFEWARDIDLARAEAAKEKAQAVLSSKSATDTDILLAKARLHRALVRISAAKTK